MRRAYVFNTGCIRRALDCTRLTNYLMANGWLITDEIPEADLVVISTCGTIRKNEELSLTAIRQITGRKNPAARVIITGCLPKINPDRIREIGDFELIPTRELARFDQALKATIPYEDIPDVNLVGEKFLDYVLAYRLFRNSYSLKIYTRLSTNRSFLKLCVWAGDTLNLVKSKLGLAGRQKIVPYYNIRIAEGCAFACSYCSIKFATGRILSKPVQAIVGELKAGLRSGHQVFQLICEDTGSYGLDLGTTFPALLREMLAVEGDYRLLIIDFGGHWLVKYYEELLPLFKAHPDKIRELYVSLQSGSDRVLKAMRRPEKSAEVIDRLQRLQEQVPSLNLRTTVIIGFPGESEQDFQQTVHAVQAVSFSEVQLNKYEDRPGTFSSRMPSKVPQRVIERRYREIKQVC